MVYYHPDTPETGGPLTVSTLFGVIALLSCVGRGYAIRQRHDSFHLQDLYLLIALLLTFTSLGLQWACVVRGGSGRHMADVEPLDVVLTLKLIIPFEALYGVTLMLIKWSILLFYQRVFGPGTASFRWVLHGTMVILFLWMLSVILETFLLCRPLEYNWNTSIEGTCGDRNAVYIIAGAINMATDIIVLFIPIPLIWNLKLPVAQRIGLIATFCLGFLSVFHTLSTPKTIILDSRERLKVHSITAISIIRLKSLMDISFADPTWTLPMGLLWTVLEPELGILVANFPFMRPYLAKLLPKAWSMTLSSRRSRKDGRENFERLPADRAVPLRTIGGGWQGSNGGVRVAEPRSTGTPGSDDSGSERGLTKDSDAGIKVHTMWTVSRE